MPSTIWIPALLLFAAAAFGTLGLVLTWEVVRDWLEQRTVKRQLVDLVAADHRGPGDQEDGESHLLRKEAAGVAVDEGWAATIRSLPGVRASLALLEQADVGWSPLTLYLLMFGAGAAVGGVALTVWQSDALLLGRGHRLSAALSVSAQTAEVDRRPVRARTSRGAGSTDPCHSRRSSFDGGVEDGRGRRPGARVG